jgi:hypothetical protein
VVNAVFLAGEKEKRIAQDGDGPDFQFNAFRHGVWRTIAQAFANAHCIAGQ